MVPTSQSLESDDCSAFQIDLGLIDEPDLPVDQGLGYILDREHAGSVIDFAEDVPNLIQVHRLLKDACHGQAQRTPGRLRLLHSSQLQAAYDQYVRLAALFCKPSHDLVAIH